MAEQTGHCTECNRPMVSQHRYNQDPAGWRGRGYCKHGGRGLCGTCYVTAFRRGTLPEVVTHKGLSRLTRQPLSDAEVARLRAMVGAA